MPKNGACNLGSINLSEFVTNPYMSTSYFNIEEFKKAVKISIRALDEVIDYGYKYHALQSQRDMAYGYRNIGLGIMGLGSLFFKMGVEYGSEDSINLSNRIMYEMFREAVKESCLLAHEKGEFPKYKDVIFDSTIIKNHFSKEEIKELKKYGLRNCSLLSVAPSGSIATMLNVTTGVEPAFRISYKRKTESLHKDTEVFYDVYIKEAEEYKSIFNTDILPKYFISSENINYKNRIYLQSIIQSHVDTAISSTINLPEEFTIEEVEQLYLYAWKKKLKGITIYRDNCARSGILTSNDKKEELNQETEISQLEWGTTIKVCDDLIGKKRKIISGCGSLHVQAWFDSIDGRLMEIYLSKGSTGGCNSFMTALSRMTSAALRTGLSFEYAIDQLKSTPACPSYSVRTATKNDTSKGNSCPNAVANVLVEMQKEINYELGIEEENQEKTEIKISKQKPFKTTKVKCPQCGGELRFEGGCNQCPDCGYSKCE